MSKSSASYLTQLGVSAWVIRSEWQPPSASVVPPPQASPPSSQPAVTLVRADVPTAVPVEPNKEPVLVLLGAGIQSIWQDEQSLEWQLWLNICQAMGWKEEQLCFIDTTLLHQESQMFSSMEEIINMGVGQVLSMETSHPLLSLLAEGVEILEMPDFEQLLSDPYAKQAFYRQAVKWR
ncbi:MAG: hypothetical protein JXR44_09855 [Thiotrichales bacterium]|nr:hypothetical protein [Thiotrichales bacterium]